MLQSSTLTFLNNLKKNNNKNWFDEHRKQYNQAREDFLLLIDSLIKNIATFDPPIGNLSAKECIFRINRDVRFSKDKRPYKNNMAGYFNKGGKKSNGAGYYLHIEPGKSFAAGGIWMPEPGVLANMRQEIDYNFEEWKSIVTKNSFRKIFIEGVKGETLTRPPKGYDESNLAIEYLKMKSFIISKPVSDTTLKSKTVCKEVAKLFQSMKPMIDFINRAAE